MAVINYKGRKATETVRKVTDEEVMNAIEEAAKQCPKTEEADRPAQNGDIAVLDFAGFCDGKQFDGGTSEGYELELGSGTFIPGFEEQLVGLSAGDEKDVNVTFPTQYSPELAGKDAVFKCKIHKVLAKTERAIDDDLAKEVFNAESLEALLIQTKQVMEAQAKQDAANETLGDILDAICEDNPRTLSEEDVAEQIRDIAKAMAYQMTGQQMGFEDFIKLSGMSEKDFTEGLRPTAERNLHVQLIIDEIAELEKIEATQEERAEYAEMMAPRFGMTGAQLLEMTPEDAFDEDIVMQKTMEFIYRNSEIVQG